MVYSVDCASSLISNGRNYAKYIFVRYFQQFDFTTINKKKSQNVRANDTVFEKSKTHHLFNTARLQFVNGNFIVCY